MFKRLFDALTLPINNFPPHFHGSRWEYRSKSMQRKKKKSTRKEKQIFVPCSSRFLVSTQTFCGKPKTIPATVEWLFRSSNQQTYIFSMNVCVCVLWCASGNEENDWNYDAHWKFMSLMHILRAFRVEQFPVNGSYLRTEYVNSPCLRMVFRSVPFGHTSLSNATLPPKKNEERDKKKKKIKPKTFDLTYKMWRRFHVMYNEVSRNVNEIFSVTLKMTL